MSKKNKTQPANAPKRASRSKKAGAPSRRDLVQGSINERNTAPDLADNRLFERIREEDPTI